MAGRYQGTAWMQGSKLTQPRHVFPLSVNATRLSEALERPPWVHRSALGDPGFSLNTVNIEWKVQKKNQNSLDTVLVGRSP